MCYATRAGFTKLGFSKSPYCLQKEDFVVTNVYPTFVQHFDKFFSSRHSMDHYSQNNRG